MNLWCNVEDDELVQNVIIDDLIEDTEVEITNDIEVNGANENSTSTEADVEVLRPSDTIIDECLNQLKELPIHLRSKSSWCLELRSPSSL